MFLYILPLIMFVHNIFFNFWFFSYFFCRIFASIWIASQVDLSVQNMEEKKKMKEIRNKELVSTHFS